MPQRARRPDGLPTKPRSRSCGQRGTLTAPEDRESKRTERDQRAKADMAQRFPARREVTTDDSPDDRPGPPALRAVNPQSVRLLGHVIAARP